jgi:hypothetical protein
MLSTFGSHLDEEQQALNVSAATGKRTTIPNVLILFFIYRLSFLLSAEHHVQHIFLSASSRTRPSSSRSLV